MTIKQLADELGLEKHKIKHLYNQLPPNWSIKVENRILLSDAAVDAIRRKVSGGELASEIPVPPYDRICPIGWGISETIGENSGEKADIIGETADNSGFIRSESDILRTTSGDGENRAESETIGQSTLTFIDLYRRTADAQIATMTRQIDDKNAEIEHLRSQLAVKDAQIDAQAAAFRQTADITSGQLAAMNAQIAEKDEQLKRAQESAAELMQRLSEAAERERQAAEQAREEPRRWWQWWKR